jgi:exosortase/archaeosortase family protein
MNLLHHPQFVRWGVRVDLASSWAWPALVCAALWPTWQWMAQRMLDGSDDPLGLLALAAMGLLLWRERGRLRASPRLVLLALSLVLATGVTALHSQVPALLAAVFALLSVALCLMAFLPRHVAGLPVAGLAVLSLPLLASLQFYAGYPLRVVTAEASSWLLGWWFEVQRSGTALSVNGKLVIVDAPCSGVQMVWFGYFTACAVVLYQRFSNRTLLLRLPAVSVLVLLGNVLRNTALVASEAAGQRVNSLAHELLGLVMLGAVCGGIAWVMARAEVSRADAVEGAYRA